MKNKLMLALLVSVPVAVRAMEPAAAASTASTASAANPDAALKELEQGRPTAVAANDPLEHLKDIFGTKSENEVANHVRHHVPGLEGLQQLHLLNGLKTLGQQGGLVDVHAIVSAKRSGGNGAAPTAQDLMQTTINIISAAYAVATSSENQQAVQQIEDDVAQSGLCACFGIKKK